MVVSVDEVGSSIEVLEEWEIGGAMRFVVLLLQEDHCNVEHK